MGEIASVAPLSRNDDAYNKIASRVRGDIHYEVISHLPDCRLPKLAPSLAVAEASQGRSLSFSG